MLEVVPGNAHSVRPVLHLGSEWIMVGVIHTHPNLKDVPPIAFSASDIFESTRTGEMLSVLCTGRHLMAILHPQPRRARLAFCDENVVRDRVNELYRYAYRKYRTATGSKAEGTFLANMALSTALGYGFYYAKDSFRNCCLERVYPR